MSYHVMFMASGTVGVFDVLKKLEFDPYQSEIVHYVDEEGKCYGISYKEVLRPCHITSCLW
jgi:hypothetical protein